MRTSILIVSVVVLGGGELTPSAGQLPLDPFRETGQSATPAYEGWYPTGDGTFTLAFGYFNRNLEETLDVPVGPANFVAPGSANQGQPTHFLPGRHWGVFTVTVPADFGDQRVVWTLSSNGETFAIPGHLHNDWLIDALHDPASGNEPPAIRFKPGGPEGRGPTGLTTGKQTSVGVPLGLSVIGRDDLVRRPTDIPYGPPDRPVMTTTWILHQGPGAVRFDETLGDQFCAFVDKWSDVVSFLRRQGEDDPVDTGFV